jgi:hypothetical protein
VLDEFDWARSGWRRFTFRIVELFDLTTGSLDLRTGTIRRVWRLRANCGTTARIWTLIRSKNSEWVCREAGSVWP